jgi:hypothetical protein
LDIRDAARLEIARTRRVVLLVVLLDRSGGPFGSGTLTSVQLVSTPEPGSIVVFSVFAVAAGIQVHRTRRRAAARSH